MIFSDPIILESENFLLRRLQLEDFEDLFKAASNPEIWLQHPEPDRYLRSGFERYFNKVISLQCPFVIIDKKTQQTVGTSSYYDYSIEKNEVVIGYTFLQKEYWGGLANFEIKKLMLDYAFKFVDSAYFHIGSTNIRSQKAVLKIGGKFVLAFEKVISGAEKNSMFLYVIQNKLKKRSD